LLQHIQTYGLSGNLNYKQQMNYFTTTGYNYRTNQEEEQIQYFATDGSTTGFIDETRDTERLRKESVLKLVLNGLSLQTLLD
jgi:hypothetical protein